VEQAGNYRRLESKRCCIMRLVSGRAGAAETDYLFPLFRFEPVAKVMRR